MTTTLEEAAAWAGGPAARIHRVGRLLRRRVALALEAAGADVSPEQWGLLLKLLAGGGAAPSDLADRVLGDRPNITRMVDGLLRKGLAAREEDVRDRRRRRVFLTDAGRELVERVWPVVEVGKRRVFGGLTQEEVGVLLRALEKIEKRLVDDGEVEDVAD